MQAWETLNCDSVSAGEWQFNKSVGVEGLAKRDWIDLIIGASQSEFDGDLPKAHDTEENVILGIRDQFAGCCGQP